MPWSNQRTASVALASTSGVRRASQARSWPPLAWQDHDVRANLLTPWRTSSRARNAKHPETAPQSESLRWLDRAISSCMPSSAAWPGGVLSLLAAPRAIRVFPVGPAGRRTASWRGPGHTVAMRRCVQARAPTAPLPLRPRRCPLCAVPTPRTAGRRRNVPPRGKPVAPRRQSPPPAAAAGTLSASLPRRPPRSRRSTRRTVLATNAFGVPR